LRFADSCGAIGNIIDSAFYGLIFNESYGQVATLFPAEGGYSSFLHGKVVDMLYFPLISGHYPQWLPVVGGREFLFFRPLFNIADSSITIVFSVSYFSTGNYSVSWIKRKKKSKLKKLPEKQD
jgi:signal peptidase II